jgi:hypothetical protein
MLSVIFFILASISNSIMDTSVHHFSTSKFKKLNPLFWDGENSWKNKYNNGDPRFGRVKWFLGLNKPVQITDAFHLFKTLMIIFLALSVVTFNKELFFGDAYNLFSFIGVMLIYGFAWNTTFSLFYNKILR